MPPPSYLSGYSIIQALFVDKHLIQTNSQTDLNILKGSPATLSETPPHLCLSESLSFVDAPKNKVTKTNPTLK
jgi:hypothetical protein